MAEFDPTEEKALLYVLGELPREKARAFEAELEAAPQLMQRVRELEEGAATLALACPPKRAPKAIWTNIENAIEADKPIIIPWEWVRNKGWVAAVACLAGWVIFALVSGRTIGQHRDDLKEAVANANRTLDAKATRENAQAELARTIEQARAEGRLDERQKQEQLCSQEAEKSTALRKQISDLQGQLALMSQTLMQQQALLNDPARLKFVGLAPVSNGIAPSAGELSPKLQQALFLAMARELGWLGDSNQVFNASPEMSGNGGRTNVGGVDFVDFRGTNSSQRMNLELAQPGNDSQSSPRPAQESPATAGALPGYVSGDHFTVALDDSVAPPGSHVTLSVGPTGGAQWPVGTMISGSNPMVFTIPLGELGGGSVGPNSWFGAGGGFAFTVNSWTPGGASNQVQFIAIPGQ